MRVEPECVYLRLEPAASLINHKTGKVRHVPAVEVHWKDRKWERRTFVARGGQTLGELLTECGAWLDGEPNLEAALDVLRGTTTAAKPQSPESVSGVAGVDPARQPGGDA